MELTQLKYFTTVADTLNFTRAAELLRVSQPALSYQVRRLETELGTTLFDRAKRRVTLTPDGELFLPLAQSVLFRADEALRVLREHLGVETGEVRVGCNPSVATYLMPSLLASFRQNFPRVRVSLSEWGDVELQRAVVEGTVDFAIITAQGSPGTLEVTPLATEDLLLALPPNHRFAGRSSISLHDLVYEEFVVPATSFNLGAEFFEACREAGFEPRVAYQTFSFESGKGFVRQGLCAAVLPRMALQTGGNEGMAIMEIREGLTRQLNLIRARNRSLTGVARALIAHIQSDVGAMVNEPGDLMREPKPLPVARPAAPAEA